MHYHILYGGGTSDVEPEIYTTQIRFVDVGILQFTASSEYFIILQNNLR